MRIVTIALLALAAASPAAAQTLEEAMAAATETNPSLAAQRSRLAASREALPQAWAEALPQISLSGGATIADRYPTPTDERTQTWNAGASASQLLFGSGRVMASTRAARASIRGAVADYDFTEQQLLLDVARAYADVRQAQAVVAARETTASNLTTLLEYAQAQFDAGVVTRTDVAQSAARQAQARTQLVQAQGQLAAAIEAYQRLVGYPPSDLQPPRSAAGLPADLQTALDVAGRASPVLRGAEASAEQADANVDVAAASGRLRVTLEAGSSLTGAFADSPGTPGGDGSVNQSQGDSVGIRASIPLFQGGAIRSRTRQQRALRSAANLEVAAAQRSVQESVTVSWTSLSSARSAVVSAREQVEAAELAYEGVRLEQETGLRSTVEVLDQEQDLLIARLALAQAERDLVVAERQLLAAMGALAAPVASPDLRGRSD